MPFGAVKLISGIDTESTPTDSQAGINLGNMVRWKSGMVEKIGGWVRYYQFPIGSVPRALHPWQDINTNKRLAVGADASLNIITSGVNNVITPQTTTTNSPLDFSTTTGSTLVTINDVNIASPTTNDSVFVQTPVSVGGVIVSGIYPINSIISTSKYTIIVTTAATTAVVSGGAVPLFTATNGVATINTLLNNDTYQVGGAFYAAMTTTVGGVPISGSYLVDTVTPPNNFTFPAQALATSNGTAFMNNGSARFVYYINLGPQPTTAGYGTGGYGTGGYGTGTAPSVGAGTPITATDWSLANWGEILLANPANGPIFAWSPESGHTTAQVVWQAPIANQAMFVTMPQQIVVALGSANSDGSPSPLRVAWSTAGDYTNWTPTSTTFAGSYIIPRGSKLVGGLQAPTQNLLWTDLAVWSMQYVNLPLVFGFSEIMSGCGLIGTHAAVLAEGTVFWMSQNQFFAMPAGSGPRPMKCSVWDEVFQDLDMANSYKIRAGANSSFNEIWWHYPSLSGGTGENDSYVKYTMTEDVWDYGSLPTGRSAWIDQSVLGSPLGADPAGFIYQHEIGYDGDGVALNPFISTGYWVIGDGQDFAFVDQALPDFTYGIDSGATPSAAPLVTFTSVDYPNGPLTNYGPYASNATVPQIPLRIRGRQMSMKIESQDAGSFWRIGLLRFRWAPAGRR